MMAVDQIARMMALDAAEQGGGTTDAYTKAETDELLDVKANLVNGKIPSSELPSYVDDVAEYASTSAFPATGESGKIYIATDTNKTYRWGGSAYVEISESLALGETASTAYPGNKGKANADAIAKKPGEITTGKQYTIDGQTVTAAEGAEVFNSLTGNKASGPFSHAEGDGTTALGYCSHAEGGGTKASGAQSHAEGGGSTASGPNSHAEGSSTASGSNSHAEGTSTTASGSNSHAEGYGTKASSANQHVQGKNNVEDTDGKYAFIIGNGSTYTDRHNAFAIDWNGLIYVNGAATGVDVSQLTPVTVDQTYSASSTNAQSGTAVKQAMDTVPDTVKAQVIPQGYAAITHVDNETTGATLDISAYQIAVFDYDILRTTTTVAGLSSIDIHPNTSIMFIEPFPDTLTQISNGLRIAYSKSDYPASGYTMSAGFYVAPSTPVSLFDYDNYTEIWSQPIEQSSTEVTKHLGLAKQWWSATDRNRFVTIRFLADHGQMFFTCDLSGAFTAQGANTADLTVQDMLSGVLFKIPKQQAITVDQNYNASSTNPQSGTAVAQALSGKISDTDYATQTTGGTIKAWTTTDGSDTILHLATQ